MPEQTSERAFETYVEEILLTKGGWNRGDLNDWDKQRAIFPHQVASFIAEAQPKLWGDMRALHGTELEKMFIATLIKELDSKGSLTVLRHGFKFYGKTFRLAYFKPAHSANTEILDLYAKNRLTVTRQVPCHPGDTKTLDMVLAVNGLPIATIELKNPMTGQKYEDAIKQYKTDRDPRAPMFNFKKRTLVHFAVDPEQVYKTTRLAGEKTFFLPFNRGSHPGEIICGKGNPQHESGYRTGYFWLDVLQSDSFLDILANFIFLETEDEKVDDGNGNYRRVTSEKMVFPRYHQLDAVRKLIATSRAEGTGRNFLIQHSAGSGKTNSISWLSHRLANLHDANERKVFDCVVVITDRQVLDRQLQEAIYQIEHAQGVVKAIDEDSKQLAEALVDGTKIVVTTLQKFPHVLKGLLHVAGIEKIDDATDEQKAKAIAKAKEWEAEIARRKYAVIVDEAHSSQSGESSRELKEILGVGLESQDEDEEPDWEDRMNQVMASRGRQRNVSFYAFTATPKGKTLELFGRKGATGLPEPFHLYSMRQAIEEEFILDVLLNYTTYDVYFALVKKIADDPNLPQKKAARELARFMTLHPHNIEQKTAVIINHFRQKVINRLRGRAKAMVVTSSRLHAVRYMEAFTRYIKDHNIPDVRPLVAFSGKVTDPKTGVEYTEPGMNTDCVTGGPISEKQLPKRFGSPDYQVLLVANKYQTGFDQPLLCAMYVDKRLDGVQAVQTLSRLNRKIPGKEAPFVLDFVNKAEDIYRAFKPYYDATTLKAESDPQSLEVLKNELNAAQVYYWSDVEGFSTHFYKPSPSRQSKDHSVISSFLQPAVDRFRAINDEEKQTQFRDKLQSYVRLYAFLSQIMPYTDPDLEMLYSYGRLLLKSLTLNRNQERVRINDEVQLEYFRIKETYSGEIKLSEGKANPINSPTDVGTGRTGDPLAPLSEIIKVINERSGSQLTEEDRLFLQQIHDKATNDEQVIQMRMANALDRFQLGVRSILDGMFIQRMAENDAIVTRYMEKQEFGEITFEQLSRSIYNAIHPLAKD